ncbi:MAG: hypothetical protein COB67_08085 [SAR324 cluster bacterium]|uniref:DUF4424 domain-containing protein n=1 Tax=SAR324 cluster bacterium TaxID=2024889 RepID=A0A2A4T258_9DELT|nr:MAG: hypothetical protein COB67_08085 [SAR324 cluster bacterium]
MKRLFFFCLFLLLPGAAFAGNGSFLILKSVYLHEAVNQDGVKLLTRQKIAYDVEMLFLSPEDTIMYQLVLPWREKGINGSGYILESDAELQKLGEKQVKVYAELPTLGMDMTNFQPVPSHKLLFTGKKVDAEDFPHLIWREVNYEIKTAKRFWAPEWAGIYRPDKSADWLNQIHRETVRLRLKGSLLQKILMGLVETGFSKKQVLLAIGDPREKQFSQEAQQEEWIYVDRKIIFKDNQVIRVL